MLVSSLHSSIGRATCLIRMGAVGADLQKIGRTGIWLVVADDEVAGPIGGLGVSQSVDDLDVDSAKERGGAVGAEIELSVERQHRIAPQSVDLQLQLAVDRLVVPTLLCKAATAV